MDQYLSSRDKTTQTDGGYIPINLPDSGPTGFKTWIIKTSDLVAGVGNVPLKLKNLSVSTPQMLPGDSWIESMFFTIASGSPSIKIGLTSNGNEILDTTLVSGLPPVMIQTHILSDTIYYFSISGGSVNIRIDFTINYA